MVNSFLDTFTRHFGEPWVLVITLVLAALSLSGKFSVTATQILLALAWLVSLVALRETSWSNFSMGAVFSALILICLAVWFRPEVVPQYFGELIPKRSILFSPTVGNPTIEIGDSDAKFLWGGPAGQPLFRFFEDSPITVEKIRRRIKVSTILRDESGAVVAELVRNQWRVTPPPKTFDRNYSDDSLEVINEKGMVVLQVRALTDRIQLQGIWYGPDGAFAALSKMPAGGAGLTFRLSAAARPDIVEPKIPKMFAYPSDLHFGELASSD